MSGTEIVVLVLYSQILCMLRQSSEHLEHYLDRIHLSCACKIINSLKIQKYILNFQNVQGAQEKQDGFISVMNQLMVFALDMSFL